MTIIVTGMIIDNIYRGFIGSLQTNQLHILIHFIFTATFGSRYILILFQMRKQKFTTNEQHSWNSN